MRWGDKGCPRCGGDLYADYADVALVCLKCGHHEPPPRLARVPLGTSTREPSSLAPQAPTAHLIALIEVRSRSRPLIEGICASHGCQVAFFPSAPPLVDEPALAGAELFIIEADRGGLAVALARRLRTQAPAVPIAVVLTCWSECEREARSIAEFVIHAPLRESEVNGVLEVMASYCGWLPSPLLAATYRARVPSAQARIAN